MFFVSVTPSGRMRSLWMHLDVITAIACLAAI